jgi:hypothetical protein
MDATPLLLRTPVSQRHCRRDPDQLLERATAARKVGGHLDVAVKYAARSGLSRARSVETGYGFAVTEGGGPTKWIFQPDR